MWQMCQINTDISIIVENWNVEVQFLCLLVFYTDFGNQREEIIMAKILKRARVDYSNNYSWIGERAGELEVDHDGSIVYIAATDIGEEALYYVSERSLFEELIEDECKEIDKTGVVEEYDTGPIVDFEGEETEMRQSEYYKCFLYLHTLIRKDNKTTDVVEYTDDYGKDIDQMKLYTLKQSEERRRKRMLDNTFVLDEDGNILYGIVRIICDESKSKWIDAINAEAVIKVNDEYKYLEACWISEVPESMSFEMNDKSIHDILTNDGDIDELVKIRETGHIYNGYKDAMNSTYKKAFETMALLISDKLGERGDLEELAEDEDFVMPEWYTFTEPE